MGAVAGKDQEKPAARLDHQRHLLEYDFAAFKCIIQIIDRRDVALRCMIDGPIALFVLPTIVRMSAMVPSRTQRGQDHCLGIKQIREL